MAINLLLNTGGAICGAGISQDQNTLRVGTSNTIFLLRRDDNGGPWRIDTRAGTTLTETYNSYTGGGGVIDIGLGAIDNYVYITINSLRHIKNSDQHIVAVEVDTNSGHTKEIAYGKYDAGHSVNPIRVADQCRMIPLRNSVVRYRNGQRDGWLEYADDNESRDDWCFVPQGGHILRRQS